MTYSKNSLLPDEAKLGMVFLLAIIIFVWGLFYLKEWRVTGDTYLVDVRLSSAVGVKSSDPILVGGVRVGKVEAVKLDDMSPIVTLRVDEPFEIPEDSQVEVISRSVMGEKSINIRKGVSTLMVPPGGTIEGTAAPGISDMFTQVDSVTVNMRNLLKNANILLDPDREKSIKSSLAGVHDLTIELRETLKRESGQINRVVANMDSLVSNVRDLSETERSKVSGTLDNLESTSGRLNAMMDELQSTSTALGNILTRIDRGEGTIGKLLQDERLYEDAVRVAGKMDRLVTSLDELVVDLKSNPGRYVTVEIF
ncbi:MAG: MCE family protein [Gemmatimonadetes bacterium]|nr:MCE family protein [Gemmatimonadota bacterium]MYA78820.1 MCE family protein [Gemmatimonadota bacterium]MYG16841.1 MCE family protein [Gemmatimonadota bacterium]MYH18038.1 MCE family protein [Gemmatimonadota bacterium]